MNNKFDYLELEIIKMLVDLKIDSLERDCEFFGIDRTVIIVDTLRRLRTISYKLAKMKKERNYEQ